MEATYASLFQSNTGFLRPPPSVDPNSTIISEKRRLRKYQPLSGIDLQKNIGNKLAICGEQLLQLENVSEEEKTKGIVTRALKDICTDTQINTKAREVLTEKTQENELYRDTAPGSSLFYVEQALSVPVQNTASVALDTALASIDQGAREAALQAARSRYHVPKWHPHWRLSREIAGHTGWVRTIAVDPTNEFFVTGADDRLIKFWDMATGKLKMTYTGHVGNPRALALSETRPYMFSVGDEGSVNCWDLHQNTIIRSYHGHTSGVYSLVLHPSLDMIFTGSRDSSVKGWDVRTRKCVFTFRGHTDAVLSLLAQPYEPQLISGSADMMIRTWDIRTGKCSHTLTNHSSGIRALVANPLAYCFASAGSDKIRVWGGEECRYEMNYGPSRSTVHSLAAAEQDNGTILVSAMDNGFLNFHDWNSGYKFQSLPVEAVSGSLRNENAVFCAAFDKTNSILITGNCDKVVRMYTHDSSITEHSHPVPEL